MPGNGPASRGKRADFSKLLITQSEQWGSGPPWFPARTAIGRLPPLRFPESSGHCWLGWAGERPPSATATCRLPRPFLPGYVTLISEREGRACLCGQRPAPSLQEAPGLLQAPGGMIALAVLPAEQATESLIWLKRSLSMSETPRYVCLNLKEYGVSVKIPVGLRAHM